MNTSAVIDRYIKMLRHPGKPFYANYQWINAAKYDVATAIADCDRYRMAVSRYISLREAGVVSDQYFPFY